MPSHDAASVAENLRQTQHAGIRSKAIVTFCKCLRLGHLFQPFWDAAGGAPGLANLMAEFSLRDVRAMCRHLGSTASAQKARPERHAGLAELVRLLHEDEPPHGVPKDPRPLKPYYLDIVPACDLGFVREWDDGGHAEWTKFQRVCLFYSHREWYEKRFLKDLFYPVGDAQRANFSAEKWLFQGNLAFSETILSTLIANQEGASRIPRDFMPVFVMPLLKRLVRRRKYDDETRDKFLSLVVRCVQVHAQHLSSHPIADHEELVRYTIRRWSVARRRDARATTATKQQTELCLERLVELLPHRSKQCSRLQDVFTKLLLDRKHHVDSYQLLRLILRHAQGYGFDLDDDTSSTISRLRDLTAQGNRWPARLFLYLDVENAISLFDKLSDANVADDFLTREPSSSSKRTVLEQDRGPGISTVDPEIVRCLLLAKSNKGADDPTWLARARTLVRERKKKSEDGREWQQRAFWARSALNLCVATGDMELLDDWILWARRFNNQPLVVRDLYNNSSFGTEEIRSLLSAVPDWDEDKDKAGDVPNDRAATVKTAIETSGRILVHLMETINMSLSQPQPQNQNWQALLRLPKLVVDRRLERKHVSYFDALFEPGAPNSDYLSSGAVEAVWKPTIDALVGAEAALSSSSRLSIEATGTYVFHKLPGRSGTVRADLASFLLLTMRTHLGSEGLRLQMHKVVDLALGVAQSVQPWLAIPFIRDLIFDDDGVDSVWHRNLLSVSFLSSLPYMSARDLLYTMADTMRERMKEQNSRPREEMGNDRSPTPPAIKVTTVKMMAQLLQDSQIIGASAACDVLLGLLAEARHIDILVAIVSSLLTILKEPTYSPVIHNRVLNALEEHLPPVLAQLSQRRSLSEADWAAVESGEAELPDVAESKPLIWLLCHQDYNSGVMSHEASTRLIKLLVRVPSQSALHNARWNKLFLARNGFSLDDERLPASPACLDVPSKLLSKFTAYVPASTFTALRDMALVNLDPTPGIARVTEAVKANRDLANSNAGKHWLAQFDNPGTRAVDRFGILTAASMLQQTGEKGPTPNRDDEGSVTAQLLQQSILTIADRLISCHLPEAFETLVTHLRSKRHGSRANWLAWREHCVPVLRSMTAMVDELRSMRKPLPGGESVPRILPSSFQLRVSMLPIPYSNPPKEPASEREVDTLVSELAGLLDWLACRRLPYHEEYTQLKKEVHQKSSQLDHVRIALSLARLNAGGSSAGGGEEEPTPTLADYLRLEMAGYLLTGAGDSIGEAILPEVRQVVRDWVASDDELVRLTGLSVQKKHKTVLSY